MTRTGGAGRDETRAGGVAGWAGQRSVGPAVIVVIVVLAVGLGVAGSGLLRRPVDVAGGGDEQCSAAVLDLLRPAMTAVLAHQRAGSTTETFACLDEPTEDDPERGEGSIYLETSARLDCDTAAADAAAHLHQTLPARAVQERSAQPAGSAFVAVAVTGEPLDHGVDHLYVACHEHEISVGVVLRGGEAQQEIGGATSDPEISWPGV